MMLKIMGAVTLIACGAALGIKKLHETSEQIELLCKLDRALALMEGEIALCCRSLPDIFLRLAREIDGQVFAPLREYCDFFSAAEAWVKWSRELGLPAGAAGAIAALGDVLGRYDGPRQCGEIAAARARLKDATENIRKEKEQKQRNYPVLGACLAGIAAMLII